MAPILLEREMETQQLYREGGSKQLADFCASQRINWTFSPEHAPHFGGFWEAAVKSIIAQVKVVLGKVKLTLKSSLPCWCRWKPA